VTKKAYKNGGKEKERRKNEAVSGEKLWMRVSGATSIACREQGENEKENRVWPQGARGTGPNDA